MAGETPGSRQLSPDGMWQWDGVKWAPTPEVRAEAPIRARFDLITLAVIAVRLWVAFPAGLGLLMFVVTPTYWRPMFSAPLGLELLAAGIIVVVGGFALTEVAGRLMRRGGGGTAAGIVLMAAIFLLQFVTLWIVLLGPALLILISTPQPG